MKKSIFTLLILLFKVKIYSQWALGGNPSPPLTGANNFMGSAGGPPANNILVRFGTFGTESFRMMNNGFVPTIVPTGPQNTSQFIGIGMNTGVGQTPWSRLHIGIPTGIAATSPYGGYRAWMLEGVTIQSANDQLWLGHRQWGATPEQQNAIINWGDDGAGGAGPDHMVFNFTGTTFGGPFPAPGIVPNSATNNGLDIFRLTNLGLVGIGPRFNNTFPPQNTLHQHQENSSPSFFQISNQASPVFGNPPTALIGPTPITPNDGLKMGIDDVNNGYLYNQENRPLMFSTNNAPAGYNSGHRLMITNVGSFTQPIPFFGPIPGAPANRTRVSISHDPTNVLTKPMSLLHLGFNMRYGFTPGLNVGWRPWMDVGMMVSSSSFVSEHAYVGMKPENGGVRNDAVLTWGGNDVAQIPVISPTRFRIIFTSPVTGQPGAGVGTSGGADGTEFMRCVTNNINIGGPVADPRIAFGNFQAFGPTLDAGNTIEINTQLGPAGNLGAGINNANVPGSWAGSTGASGLRFRDLTSLSVPVPTAAYTTATINPTHVLTVDGNGDVVKIVPTASVQTNNGISTTSLGVVQLGINCPETNTAIVSQFQLINDRQLPMSNFNFCFNNPIPPNTPFGPGGNRVGIGTNNCTPGNRLEVNRNTGSNPISGLRLTDLAGAAPLPTNNQVLSVDPANGDVILTTVPAGTATGIGNYCVPGPQNPLVGSDYEIPTGGFNYRFTGQSVINPAPGLQQNVVSVGYNCGVPYPVAKFNVLEQQTLTPLSFANYAGYFRNLNPVAAPTGTGVISGGIFGESKGANIPSILEPINIGGVFEGQNGFFNVGTLGRNAKLSTPGFIASGGYNIGGAFLSDTNVIQAGTPLFNYGVYARASNAVAGNYGILAQAAATGGTVGPNYAGYFVGDVVKTGSDNFTSDQNLKQNINTLTNGLNLINQLSPKTFSYQINTYPQMGLPNGLQYGLIAQDVQTVLPALVNNVVHPSTGTNSAINYLTLEYTQLIPILIKAVQELSQQNQQIIQQNQAQDSLIQVLTQNINACCENQQAKQTGINGNGKNAQQQVLNQMNIDLSDKDVIVLNQNIPNPYAEHTTITYNVPVQFKYAQMIFKTIDGRIIKTTDLEKGKGQLNVFASDLSNGLYMYTLIVDGKEFDTKKMVKQN